jgi:hypothetical protein
VVVFGQLTLGGQNDAAGERLLAPSRLASAAFALTYRSVLRWPIKCILDASKEEAQNSLGCRLVGVGY